MFIAAPAVVVRVYHPQVPAQFVNHAVNIASEIRVTGIETNTHLHRSHGSQDPEQVARVSKQQMRQFVLEYASDLKLAASFSDLIQSFCRPFEPFESFPLLFQIPALGARMDHEISH